MRTRFIGLFLLAVIGSGCTRNSPASPDGLENLSGDVSAIRVSGGILLTNGTSEAVAFLAYNPQALVQWAQCADQSPGCLRLPAGSTLTIRDQDVELYAPGLPEAAVLFWRVLKLPGGGFQIEDIKEVVVPLK